MLVVRICRAWYTKTMKPFLKTTFIVLLILFALVGLAFSAVFVGMQFGIFNVRGSSLERNAFFTGDETDTKAASIPAQPCVTDGVTNCAWDETPEWLVVEGGLQKDAALIAQVADQTGVSERMIASVVIPEQIRFFTSEREVFKRYFEPLKILGSLSQFSLGVSGIKQETARKVEEYANDPTSPFYPGPEYAAMIAYPAGVDRDAELFRRLTDEKDHHYSYLYTAIYLKEVAAQWERAGFPIADNAEAMVTLFNIGFANSRPNADPKPGGAQITAGGRTYAFGELGALFYHSDHLRSQFSR